MRSTGSWFFQPEDFKVPESPANTLLTGVLLLGVLEGSVLHLKLETIGIGKDNTKE